VGEPKAHGNFKTSQNLVHAKKYILIRARCGVGKAQPELYALDFAPKRRPEDNYCAFSGDHRTVRPADALGSPIAANFAWHRFSRNANQI
jgi:hypothetical protein